VFLASMADEALPPRAARALDKTSAALDSVETLLEALLDISRLESGRLTARVEPVPMGPQLSRLAEEFAPLAAQRGLRLRVRATDAVGLTDATWARRILQNLIGNAIRYTDTGGVLVGLRRTAAGLRIDVVDTGPGIPETERDNIFREFHRLNARASAAQGMGLGLAIVERAAAMLGHRVTLDSTPGRGSRFALHLPAAPVTAPPAGPGDAAARPRLARDLVALLIAPDGELRRALVHLLEGWGVGVLDLADPDEALPLIDEIGLAPDFVLLDTRLGDEAAGLGTLAALAARHGPLPMRLLTASRDDQLRHQASRAGAGLIYKPVDTRILERFVARVGAPTGLARSAATPDAP
jgi:two-component system, sensor histidine kinase